MIARDMIPSEVNVVLKDIWPMLLLFSIVLFTIRVIDVISNKKSGFYIKICSFLLLFFICFYYLN